MIPVKIRIKTSTNAEDSDSIRVVWEWADSTKPQSIKVDYGITPGVYTTATTTVQISDLGSNLHITTALQSIQPGTLIYVQVTTTPNGIEGTSAAYLAQNYTSYLATNIRTTSFTIAGQVKPTGFTPSYSQIKIFCWQNFGEQQQSITIDSNYTATPINISSLTANTLYTFNFVDPDRNYLTDAVFSSDSNTWFPNFYVTTGPEAPTDFTASYGIVDPPTTILLSFRPMGTFLKINLYISEGLIPTNSSVANMKGRIYSEYPGLLGIQSLSTSANLRTHSTNKSSGIIGMHMRSQDS